MEKSSPVKVFKTREAVAIIFLCGFLLIPTAFALSSLRIQGAEEEERAARLPVPPTATPSPVVKVDNSYGQAIAQAMSAANLVQSASSQDDWKLVVSRWQKSISLLKSITKADPNHAKAQTKAVEYQKNLAYAQVRMSKPGQSAVVAIATAAKPSVVVDNPAKALAPVATAPNPFPSYILNRNTEELKQHQTGFKMIESSEIEYSMHVYDNRFLTTFREWPYTLSSDNHAEWKTTDCSTGWIYFDEYRMVGDSGGEAFSPGSEYQNYDIRRSECEKMGLAVSF